jgi:type II secretory pathway pseudopilin PulG
MASFQQNLADASKRRTSGSEAGETLIEILVTLTIVSIAVATLLGGLMTSTMTSATHRNITTLDGVLRSFVESARNSIETQPSNGTSGPLFTACATPSSYTVVGNPNPGSGVVGASLTVFGTGSTLPTSSATATFTQVGGSTTATAPATVSAGPDGAPGGAASTFNVPTLPYGTYSVTPFGSSLPSAASTFTVTPWVGAMSPAVAGSVGPGTKVSFPVTGFGASKGLSVSIGGSNIATGVTTAADGTATASFTIPSTLSSTQVASVTVSDGSESAPSVLLTVANDTAPADNLPLSSTFKYYTLASSIQYWNGTGFDSTTACSSSPDQKLQDLTYTLYDSETGSAASDALSIVVGSFGPLTSTSTALASSANPSVVGQSVTYTATVSAVSPGTGTPPNSDTVNFEDGTTSISGCSARPLTAGVATCTTTYTSPGTHSVSAVFSGDGSYSGSTSNTLAQVVNQASTTTSLASSANPAVTGQAVTLTATVAVTAPGSGTVSSADTVNFLDNGTTIAGCGAVATSAGVATCNATFTTAGTHSLTATSSGDTNFAGSTGSLSQTVNKAATSTALSSSANPSVTGQSVTYTATVTVTAPGGGTPSSTDTVKFSDGATTITGCGAVTVNWATGQATCTTTYPAIGSHTITAAFSGDANYATSSGTLTQTVNTSATSTTLTSSSNPVAIGTAVTYTATVAASSPGAGIPSTSDKVTFMDNGAPISAACTNVAINASGKAACPVTYTNSGTHQIVATSTGDSNYQGSSATLTQTVVTSVAYTTTTSLTANPNPVGHTGQDSVTYTATVTASPGGGRPPNSYTVTFTDGGTTITGCASKALNNGQATCTTSYNGSQTGSHSIKATFNGDATYTGSSATLTETVN